MKIASFFIILILPSCLFTCSPPEPVNIRDIAIIPALSQIETGKGYFEIDATTKVSVQNDEQKQVAMLFFKHFQTVSAWQPQITVGADLGDIVFQTDTSLSAESYLLESSPKSIVIKAGAPAGFFYALQTLRQLLPVAFSAKTLQENIIWKVPAVKIADKPAFGWRGYMLDVSRHFFEKEDVKKVLDFMAELKLNRFHWHLADDQGWRLEIKNFPKLTTVGAWRVDYTNTDETISNWFGRPVQQPGEEATYGGFYTQEDVREIVAYAKERFIEVIPEIDMPGHAQATIAAYPEIGCVNAAPFVATGGVTKNNTYNPGKEETFEFIETMLNEVMDLFPFDYIHIGGDECNKSQWLIDPHAQRRMKEEGLENVEELQSYFIRRVEKIINARNRNMIGWDEILEGGLAPNATVMSWRGEEGGIKSAKAGHDVIMTPSKYCYIDLKQGHDDLEPNLGYSQLLLSTAYNYKVIPENLTPEEASHILGIQANMWTESISDWGKLTYMTFPRLYAIAENAWTLEEDQGWDDFVNRLYSQMQRLDKQGVRYAKSAFNVWIDHSGDGQSITLDMRTEVSDLDIYYTLDGSDPTPQKTLYNGSIQLNKSATVKAASFRDGRQMGNVSTMHFPLHLAGNAAVTYRTPYWERKDAGGSRALTDYNYARSTISDSLWQGFLGDMDVDVIFPKNQEVEKVALTCLRFTISGVYLPEKIEVWGAEDGKKFVKLGQVSQLEESHTQGRNKVTAEVNFSKVNVKALRIKSHSVSPIPAGHHRAGESSKIYVDEIVVH